MRYDNVQVDVFESSDRFGCGITTETGGVFTYDLGRNSMNAKHVPIYHLLRILGLQPRMTQRAMSHRFLVLDNGRLKAVLLYPGQFLKIDLLP